MRIKSQFRDYYDAGQQYGQDNDLLYIRKEETIYIPLVPKPSSYPDVNHFMRNRFVAGSGGRGNLNIHYVTVGFCGRIYPLLFLLKTSSYGVELDPVLCFNLEQVTEFVEANFDHKEIEQYHEGPPKGKNKRAKRHWYEQNNKEAFTEFFEEFAAEQDAHKDFFEEHKCPIFVAAGNDNFDSKHQNEQRIFLNACLRPYEFYRLFDVNKAFQELQMYLGNVANPEKPIPQMTDKDQVGIHGFDKWSFRKMPQK